MKSSYTWTIIVVLLLCINTLTLVMIWRQKRQMPPVDTHIEVKDFLIKELSLTNSQLKQFDSLRNSHRSTVDSLNDVTRKLKDDLFDNINNPVADKKLTDSIAEKIGYNTAMIDNATYYHFRKLRSILNQAQQKKFDSIIQQVLRMMGAPMPPRNPGGPGDGRPGPPPVNGPGGGPPPGDKPPY